jgi:anthranilate synthase component 2
MTIKRLAPLTCPAPRNDKASMSSPRVVLVDNYDSFTWNLVHDFGALGATVDVVRNDEIGVAELMARRPDAIVLSPGPCAPKDAGICLDVIKEAGATIPIFGVCLGHQAIGEAFGGDVVRAPLPIHGKVATIEHRGETIFRGLNGPFQATRYHSLVVEWASLPPMLNVTAETDGLIMAVSHKTLPIHGVQFHPESIASENGRTIMKNFLDLAAMWNARPLAGAA